MEMKFFRIFAFATFATFMLTLSTRTVAEEKCFSGNQETGELAFSGAVEGTGFTGRFGEFSVRYCMAESGPVDGRIHVQVGLSSADTENRERDETLKGEAFFAVEQYPDATWDSGSITAQAAGYLAQGELELKSIRSASA